MANLPVISVFGIQELSLETPGPVPEFETRALDCRCHLTDDNLYQVLAEDKPVAIISIGKGPEQFPNLVNAPFTVKQMWCHHPNTGAADIIGRDCFGLFLQNALSYEVPFPLVSVITPTYQTGEKIHRPWNSLLAQTYPNWEWVIIDDSEDDGKTFGEMRDLAKTDYRVRAYQECRHSGVIGNVKRTGFDLARGQILVELDHDDELTPQCLEWLVKGFHQHPEVGFIYTDFAESDEGGFRVEYGPGWGLGYGSYRTEVHNGMEYSVVNSPHINAKVMRHIVGAPNHIRAWRTDAYYTAGRHCPTLHVVDDYELLIRTFLTTRMGHIPQMAYVQYRNQAGNTHQVRNQEIQRLVRHISVMYDQQIHQRLLELGVDDFVWDPKGQEPAFYRLGMPPQAVESHCTVTIEV